VSLGTEVGFGLSDIVFDGTYLPPRKGHSNATPFFLFYIKTHFQQHPVARLFILLSPHHVVFIFSFLAL